MHKHILTCVLGLAVVSSACAQSVTTKIAPQKGWRSDWASAKALAQKTGKPLMVVFRCDP